jgi:uncharacterized membrane protein YesL
MTGAETDRVTMPAAPRLPGAVRAAVTDFLEHSWRLVAANLAWGVGVLALLAASAATPLAWLLAPLLALPTVGIYRTAALIVRGQPVSIREGFAAWGRFGARALLVGTLLVGCVVVLATNLVSGLEARGVVGWSLATFAGWGLAATGVLAAIVWPLLVDPTRSEMGLRGILRLTALLALAYPLRFGALAVLLLALVALSTLAVVLVLSVSIGLAALVACRYVLPAADRFSAHIDRLDREP